MPNPVAPPQEVGNDVIPINTGMFKGEEIWVENRSGHKIVVFVLPKYTLKELVTAGGGLGVGVPIPVPPGAGGGSNFNLNIEYIRRHGRPQIEVLLPGPDRVMFQVGTAHVTAVREANQQLCCIDRQVNRGCCLRVGNQTFQDAVLSKAVIQKMLEAAGTTCPRS